MMFEGSTDDGGGPRSPEQDPSFGSIPNWGPENEYSFKRSASDTRVFTDPDPGNSIMPNDKGRYPSWVSNLHPGLDAAWFDPEWIPFDGLLQAKVEEKLHIDSRPEFDRLLYDLNAGLDHQVEEERRHAKNSRRTTSAAASESRYSFKPLFDHSDGPRRPVIRPKSNAIASSRKGPQAAVEALTKKKRNSDATDGTAAIPKEHSRTSTLSTTMGQKSSSHDANPVRSSRRSSDMSRRGEEHRRQLSPVREQEHSNPGSATKQPGRKHGQAHPIVYSPLQSKRSKAKLDTKIKQPSMFSSRAKILAFRDAHAAATERNYKEVYKSGDDTDKRSHDRGASFAADRAPSKTVHETRGKIDKKTDSEDEEDSEREAVRMFVRDRRAAKKLAKERERAAARQMEDDRADRHKRSRERSHEHSTHRDDRHHRHEHRRSSRHGYDGHRSSENYSDADLFTRQAGQHSTSRALPSANPQPGNMQRRETAPPVYAEPSRSHCDSANSGQHGSPSREPKRSSHEQRTRRRHNSMPTGDRARSGEESASARRAHSGARDKHHDETAASAGRRGAHHNAPQSWPFVYQPSTAGDERVSRRRVKQTGLSALFLRLASM